jgi:hypothetical protein
MNGTDAQQALIRADEIFTRSQKGKCLAYAML